MKLQTNIPLEPLKNQFDYHNNVLLMGSCFASNIGKKLEYYKFQVTTNPFGTIFNPIAIEQLLEAAVLDKTFTENDVFELDGIWKSFAAHSDLNALSRLGTVIHLQEAQQLLRNELKTASHLFITLGTAWVYRHKEQEIVVANCHKVAQKEFSKELLSVDEVAESLSKMVTLVKALNPKIQITFTVSPVRHLKDGFIENSRSKAHLISAVHQIVNEHDIYYFPAYELMMDELRDYRFYKTDMLHPSDQAVDYIWDRFIKVYAFAKALQTLKEVETIQRGLSHRPFNPDSESHLAFLKKLKKKERKIQEQYPFIKF